MYIHKNNPHPLDELKRNIEGSILKVMTQCVHNVGSNMRQNVGARIAEYGGHFQSLWQDCKCDFNRRINILSTLKYFLIGN
jgi:hypothetical protein